MIDTGYFLLAIAALLPVLVSGAVEYIDRVFDKKYSYWGRQIVIGILFGILAIVGTEWGIRIGGSVVNCRDAPVLCAGLLFGGPAGIIAGLIGGIERFIAVAWGAGYYTQVACSISTALAGFYAAGIRRFILEDNRPSWSFAFITGLVMESFHMAMVFVTHLDAMSEAFNVVLVCTPPMLIYNSFSVMLATIFVSVVSKGDRRRTLACENSIINTMQSRLLATVIIAFVLLFPLEYALQTAVTYTANEQYLIQNLNNARQLEVSEAELEASLEAEGETYYYSVGETGYILLSRVDSGKIVSGPRALLGETLSGVGLGDETALARTWNVEEDVTRTAIYEAGVAGTDSICMDQLNGSYLMTAVYPRVEAYRDRDRAMTLAAVAQIMLFAVVFLLSFFFMKRKVVVPIHHINDALEEITAGNLDTEVEERSALEFAELSDDINTTVDALQRYTREAEERMAQELAFAKAIQRAALPGRFPPYPERTEFDIFARMDAAKEVGGDFYDFFFTHRYTLDFLIADVSGKGIPAAMFMMSAKTKIKSYADSGLPVEEVFTQSNNSLNEENESDMFVTSWLGSIDLKTGDVSYVNAGHNHPLIRHRDGEFEFINRKPNFILAAWEDIAYTRQELTLEPGDIIFLYTDGVTEAMNVNNELYGNDRLLDCLNAAQFDTMEELCAWVKADVDSFANGAEQADDITMLALCYKGPAE